MTAARATRGASDGTADGSRWHGEAAPAVLATTCAEAFRPGTNLKGEVAGANWLFLRRQLPADHCLCIGVPSSPTLTALAAFAGRVTVGVGSSSAARAVDARAKRAGLSNVTAVIVGRGGTLALPDASADLVAIFGWRARRRLRRDADAVHELFRLLRADGQLYYEYRAFDPLRRGLGLAREVAGTPSWQRFWLTPPDGEAQTAVPLHDADTIGYFLRARLYSASLDVEALGRWRRRAAVLLGSKRSRRDAVDGRSGAAGAGIGRARRRSRLRAWFGSAARPWIARLSDLLDRHALPARVIGRRGVLVGHAAGDGPPEYLRALAAASGLDLQHCRWGLSARGEYSTRKVLFFLRPAAEPPSSGASYIVKLVRSPAFNARLENEHRALVALERMGIGDSATVPRARFFGHQAGLAIVGETMIEGEPFRQRTSSTPDCPCFGAAVDWLTELAVRTRRPGAQAAAVAAALDGLLTQFTDLYRPEASERAFLARQVAALAASPPPLVFQHGDPGPWNMLVTADGRVALLDWEAGDPAGLPLWDLFYFLRAYCADAARAEGRGDPIDGWSTHFIGTTPLGARVAGVTQRYAAAVGVPEDAVGPLFYTCWMHRALKEATRLRPGRLHEGHSIRLLRLVVARRESPGLRALIVPAGNPAASVVTVRSETA